MENSEYSPEEIEILEQRARELGKTVEQEAKGQAVYRVVVMAVGNERFGIPVKSMVEVVRTPNITRLPELPEWMPGIIQIRGRLISVVDLGRWFRVSSSPEAGFVAILTGRPGLLGLLVSAIVDFRVVYASEIVQTIQETELSTGRPFGATTRDLLTILDPERLFRSQQIMMGGDHWSER